MRRLALIPSLAIACMWHSPSLAQDPFGACRDRSNPPGMIQECTALIEEPSTEPRIRAGAYFYRCQGYDLAGNPEAALPDCQQALKMLPDRPVIYNSLSIVYRNLDRLEESEAAADKAVALGPEIGGLYATRADIRCARGRVRGAVEDRLKAMELGFLEAERLQAFLQAKGYYSGAIDGIFGRGSRGALEAWTRDGCP